MAKCSECGFLALRNIETRELDEAEEVFRKHGKPIAYKRSHPAEIMNTPFFTEETLTRYVHEDLPICFARSYNLLGSFTELAAKNYSAEKAVLVVINEERQCESFTKWHQGSTPKEHREMIDRERRDKFEADIRRSDKRWHIVEIVLIILLTGLFTLLGAFISRGVY